MTTLMALLAFMVPGDATHPPAMEALHDTEFCSVLSEPPAYYAIALVPTQQVVGTGRAGGQAHMTFDRSPFGVELAADGSYRSHLSVQVDNLPDRDDHDFVVWVTTPSIDRMARVGTLDADGVATGPVEWNKFLVAVTMEPAGYEATDRWSGPIILRGMSRSGQMHTMAGHGPFEQLECRTFGY